jgi:hypothetical protein
MIAEHERWTKTAAHVQTSIFLGLWMLMLAMQMSCMFYLTRDQTRPEQVKQTVIATQQAQDKRLENIERAIQRIRAFTETHVGETTQRLLEHSRQQFERKQAEQTQ